MVGGGQWVEKLLKERPPLMEVVQEMLHSEEQVCKRGHDLGPKDWRVIYELDFQKDFEALTQWYDKLLTDTPPPPDINGLYFVLWPPPQQSPESTVAVLASGSRDQETNRDWNRDGHWSFDNSVYVSPLLTSLYAQFVPPNVIWPRDRDKAMFICWQFVGLVVSEWISGPMRAKMLGDAPRRHIEVGYDFFIRFNLGDLTPANTPAASKRSAD